MKKFIIYSCTSLAVVFISAATYVDSALADRDSVGTVDSPVTTDERSSDSGGSVVVTSTAEERVSEDRIAEGTVTSSIGDSGFTDSASTSLRVIDEVRPLQEVEVELPNEIPKGIFWKKVGQKLVLFFTFDAIKDAEKKLEYAEENMLLAEFIIENSDNKSDQELAAELIDVANDYVQSITEKSQQLLDAGKGNEEVKILFENLAIHTQNKQMLLDNIKNLIDVTKVPQLGTALQNGNKLGTITTNTLLNVGTELGIQPILAPKLTIPAAVLEFLKNDQDGDGLLDSKEDELGTSKFDFDTDHDGISDVQEVDVTKTNPLKADTDGDGFWDGYELINGYSPVGAQKLDIFPTKAIQNIDPNTGMIKDLQPKPLTPGGLNPLGSTGLGQ